MMVAASSPAYLYFISQKGETGGLEPSSARIHNTECQAGGEAAWPASQMGGRAGRQRDMIGKEETKTSKRKER